MLRITEENNVTIDTQSDKSKKSPSRPSSVNRNGSSKKHKEPPKKTLTKEDIQKIHDREKRAVESWMKRNKK